MDILLQQKCDQEHLSKNSHTSLLNLQWDK